MCADMTSHIELVLRQALSIICNRGHVTPMKKLLPLTLLIFFLTSAGCASTLHVAMVGEGYERVKGLILSGEKVAVYKHRTDSCRWVAHHVKWASNAGQYRHDLNIQALRMVSGRRPIPNTIQKKLGVT